MFNPTPYFLYMYEDDRKEKLDKAANEIALYTYDNSLYTETEIIKSILHKYKIDSPLSVKESEYLENLITNTIERMV